MPRTLTERMIWRNKDGIFTGTATKNFGDLGNVWITVRQAGAEITVEMRSHTHPALDKPPISATDLLDAERIIAEHINHINTLRSAIPTAVYFEARKAFDNIITAALDKMLHPEHWLTVAETLARRAEKETQNV